MDFRHFDETFSYLEAISKVRKGHGERGHYLESYFVERFSVRKFQWDFYCGTFHAETPQ